MRERKRDKCRKTKIQIERYTDRQREKLTARMKRRDKERQIIDILMKPYVMSNAKFDLLPLTKLNVLSDDRIKKCIWYTYSERVQD